MNIKTMIRIPVIAFILCCGYMSAYAQIESVKIETYYIADADDATDTIGGHLEEGSVTYRLFIDLLPGSSIISIYGDANHPLVFSSEHPFFNHKEEGITFGKDVNRNRYSIGTVALDTYITLGQCSKTFGQGAYFGVPKDKDLDGSTIGGENNDGGSHEISDGLLSNEDSRIGLPLTSADGLMISTELPGSWVDIGFIDLISNSDTTIFGSTIPKNHFSMPDVVLKNSGVNGVDPEQNEILVAQLTTKGEIKFEINLEVEIIEDDVYKTVKYVARNVALSEDEIFEPLLNYPYECGCTDPDYLEASSTFACTDNSKCITPVVLGCMDSLACNYDPAANFNIQDVCCYIGYCNDLDISVICPDLRPRGTIDLNQITLFPNPAVDELMLDLDFVQNNDIHYAIYDMYGRTTIEGILFHHDRRIDVATMRPGYFTLRLTINEKVFVLPFVKM